MATRDKMSYCKPHHFACECREEFHKGIISDLLEKNKRLTNSLERIAQGRCPKIAGMASDYRDLNRKEMMQEAKWIIGETKENYGKP